MDDRITEFIEISNSRIKDLEKKQNKNNVVSEIVALVDKSLEEDCCQLCGTVNPPKEKLKDLMNRASSPLTNEELSELEELRNSTYALSKISHHDVRPTIKELEYDINNIELRIKQTQIAKKENDDRISLNSGDTKELSEMMAELESKRMMLENLKKTVEDNTKLLMTKKANKQSIIDLIKRYSKDETLVQKLNIIEDLTKLFDATKTSYRNKLKNEVGRTAEEIFLKVREEKEFNGLKINENYGLCLMKDDIQIDARSSGYEGLIAVSLIGALHKNAPIHAPLIMDAGLEILDADNRRNLVRELPNIFSQTITFIKDNDLDPQTTRKDLSGHNLSEFKIVQNDIFDRTIQPGSYDSTDIGGI